MAPPFEKPIKTPTQACRVPIFAPTRKPTEVVRLRVKTQWGQAVITGRLGQPHRDVIDALLGLIGTGGEWREAEHGGVEMRFDSAALRKKLGWARWDYRHILNVLEDLRLARVVMPDQHEVTGIITRVAESARLSPPARRRHAGKTAKWAARKPDDPSTKDAEPVPRGGMMWIATISGAWIRLMREMTTEYPRQVFRMRYGVSQAATRLMLSHQAGARYHIETVLEAVNAPTGHWARAKKEIERDAQAMADCGVMLTSAGMLVRGTVAAGQATAHRSGAGNEDAQATAHRSGATAHR